MSYENQICELYFLLHRNNVHEIGSRLTLLLRSFKCKTGSHNHDNNNLRYLKTLYLLIGHVRDIYFGHGERDLAYMMIYIWYKFYPVLAIYAFHQFVLGSINERPYGCWNDIKYFCKFISCISDKGIHDPLIDIAVSCANHQLLLDMDVDSGSDISNISKWIPRENKIDWLFEKLVVDWFSRIGLSRNSSMNNKTIARVTHSGSLESMNYCSGKGLKKDLSYLKKIYRQMIVGICKRSFSDKQTIKNVFQSVSKSNSKSKLTMNDTYEKSNGGFSYFHNNVFIGTYIKSAVAIINNNCSDNGFDTCIESIWLNKIWCQMLSSFFDNKCPGGIPVIDISADISNESLYHAIGFACLIAIKSGLFRILLVSNTPIWIEFTNSDSICSIVNKIWSSCLFRSGSQFSVSFHFLIDAFSNTSIINPLLGQSTDCPKKGGTLSMEMKPCTECPQEKQRALKIHELLFREKRVNTSVKLFIFSQRFLFDWSKVVENIGTNCSFVFWNIGKDFSDLKADFFMEDHKEILFVSGYNTALFSKFSSGKICLTGSYDFLLESLYSQRYKSLSDYFDSQTSTASATAVCGSSSATSSNN
jgi:hypothetical protein